MIQKFGHYADSISEIQYGQSQKRAYIEVCDCQKVMFFK